MGHPNQTKLAFIRDPTLATKTRTWRGWGTQFHLPRVAHPKFLKSELHPKTGCPRSRFWDLGMENSVSSAVGQQSRWRIVRPASLQFPSFAKALPCGESLRR